MTRKGVLNLVTFVVVWYFILVYPLRFAADVIIRGKRYMHGLSMFDFIGLGGIQQWPIAECEVLWHVALIIFPILSISLAADQTCSDRERGTIRFILQRTSRDRLFFGRFVGTMIIQSCLIILAGLTTFGLVMLRDTSLFALALSNSFAIIANVILAILPFTAMMAVLSVTVQSARQATVWAILIWIFLSAIIGGFAHFLPQLDVLKILIPGYQLADLAQLAESKTLDLAYIPLLQSLVLLLAGRYIMTRQSL